MGESAQHPVRHDAGSAAIEIRELVARLAILADSGEVEEYVACFTPDAVWELIGVDGTRAMGHEGVDAIRAGVHDRRRRGIQGPGSSLSHMITTQSFEVADGTARGRVYYCMLSKRDGSPVVTAYGEYFDEYRSTANGWKLAHRRICPK